MEKMSSSNDSKPDNYQINAKICRLVERYSCMYDRSHPHYLKKDVVDKAWVKIAKEMDDSIPSCKERWRNIRTSFARSINVNKIPASANRTKPYYLHEELQFLARHITPGIPVSRRSNAYYSAGEESEVIEVSVGEESFEGFSAMVQDEDESQGHQSSADEATDEVKTEKQKPPPVEEEEHEAEAVQVQVSPVYPPKKRIRTMEMMVPEVELQNDIKPTEYKPDSDFDLAFLQGLLPEMKAMDFRQKITFKRRIYEIMGEIFENPQHTTTSSMMMRASLPANTSPSTSATTMTVVNATDLAMIRRLNNLLQSPSIASSTVTAVPKNVASITSTVRSATPSTATVAVHRGALTRSSTNLLRVTMVNPPATSPNSNPVPQPNVVKQEPEVLDD